MNGKNMSRHFSNIVIVYNNLSSKFNRKDSKENLHS